MISYLITVRYPDVEPPTDTAFSVYLSTFNEELQDREGTVADRKHVVAGESTSVQYFTAPSPSNLSEVEMRGYGCEYMLAIHNKTTGKVTLQSAPLHIMSRRVRALAVSELDADAKTPSASQVYAVATAQLGTAFGTKKAQARIRANERNTIDPSAMEHFGVKDAITTGIESKTSGLLTEMETKEVADENRLIPPHDANAETPSDVYKLHDVIPDIEWRLLKEVVRSMDNKSDEDGETLLWTKRKEKMGYKRSEWCNERLKNPNLGKTKL